VPAADRVKAMTAHVNQHAGRRESLAMAAGGDYLIQRADSNDRSDESNDNHIRSLLSAELVRNGLDCLRHPRVGE
jgi:hypothetical protein